MGLCLKVVKLMSFFIIANLGSLIKLNKLIHMIETKTLDLIFQGEASIQTRVEMISTVGMQRGYWSRVVMRLKARIEQIQQSNADFFFSEITKVLGLGLLRHLRQVHRRYIYPTTAPRPPLPHHLHHRCSTQPEREGVRGTERQGGEQPNRYIVGH